MRSVVLSVLLALSIRREQVAGQAAGAAALIGHNASGACPGGIPPNVSVVATCYDAGAPTVGCRDVNPQCDSNQMEADSLRILTEPGCVLFEWTWLCTARELAECTPLVWCDPIALCHAGNGTCSCPGNLTFDANQTCGCPTSFYIRNNATCAGVTVCAVGHYELAAPTTSSDRVCATYSPTAAPTLAPTATPTTSTPTATPTSTPTLAPSAPATRNTKDTDDLPIWLWVIIGVVALCMLVFLLIVLFYFCDYCCGDRQVCPSRA